ncbi:zinc-binding dehydrogenase [Prescottella defluvii]|nr:zinc-binding dehydrogenase [Prescottella defluvii]
MTAWQALVDTATVTTDTKVLIHAASGGVGHLAVQLGTYLGAEVTAVTSTRGQELVQELGAAHVIDRSRPEWPTQVPAQDVVIDTVGGDTTALSLQLAQPSGSGRGAASDTPPTTWPAPITA